jgi:putative Holliday junction resolvase
MSAGKILALDIGDQWTGIAISDVLQMMARPLTSVSTQQLEQGLEDIFSREKIEIVVVGYPKTMRGGESDQTRKVIVHKEALEKKYSTYKWVLWDERLSSKRADSVRAERGRTIPTKEEKLKSHAVAAAFVLDLYLTFLRSIQER